MEFKILNLNCWLLPPPFSIENTRRLSGVIQLINNIKPEIFTLQEVWLSTYTSHLIKSLPKYFIKTSDSLVYNKTGLVIGSSLPVKSVSSRRFKTNLNINLIELVAQKGFIRLDLLSGISVINIHSYAPLFSKEKRITIGQFNLLKQETNDTSTSFILTGDFNLTTAELEGHNEGWFKLDPNTLPTLSSKNRYTKTHFNRFGRKDEKVDHILVRSSRQVSIQTTLLDDSVLSDHYATLSVLRL